MILGFVKMPQNVPSWFVRTDGQHGQAADKIMTRANATLTFLSINDKVEGWKPLMGMTMMGSLKKMGIVLLQRVDSRKKISRHKY